MRLDVERGARRDRASAAPRRSASTVVEAAHGIVEIANAAMVERAAPRLGAARLRPARLRRWSRSAAPALCTPTRSRATTDDPGARHPAEPGDHLGARPARHRPQARLHARPLIRRARRGRPRRSSTAAFAALEERGPRGPRARGGRRRPTSRFERQIEHALRRVRATSSPCPPTTVASRRRRVPHRARPRLGFRAPGGAGRDRGPASDRGRADRKASGGRCRSPREVEGRWRRRGRCTSRERGDYADCPVHDRYLLGGGIALAGPAIVEEVDSTTVVHPGGQTEKDQGLGHSGRALRAAR